MQKMRPALFWFLFILSLGAASTFGQVAAGTPPFGSYGGGPDVLNLANLNAHFTMPILNKAGRGMNFTYDLAYDTSVWTPVVSGSTLVWQPSSNWGWGAVTQVAMGYLTNYQTASDYCGYYNVKGDFVRTGTIYAVSGWTYHDKFGRTHYFAGTSYYDVGTNCPGSTGFTIATTDGSGYTLQALGGSGTVIARNGTSVVPPVNSGTGSGTKTDTNGNQISVSSMGVFTDTLGAAALSVTGSGTSTSPLVFAFTPPAGGTAQYTMKYTAFAVQTNFGCSGIGEYAATNISLVTEIDLPDVSVNPNDKYMFSYEATPGHSGDVTGRLASVTLPTGGTISYAYSGGSNGITCADGSTATLTRTTPDGTWTYAHSESGTAWTTTITDPQSNVTSMNFQGIYVTERQEYQGAVAPAKLLRTKVTCYNGNTSNCNSTAVALPITQTAVTVQWPGTSGLQSQAVTKYDRYGDITETDEYSYGTGAVGALVRKTATVYAGLGNGIVNRPSSVTVYDGSNNVKAQTTYAYDGSAVTATSGTPQHVSISGSRGNATTATYLVQGSTTLSKTYTYFDTGNVQTATDANGAQRTNTFGACGNSFMTSVSESLGLSKSMVWNCTGGVQTSFTDENGMSASIIYNDNYFWRQNSVRDAASNVTNYTYTGANQAESSLLFNNGNSTIDMLTTLDTLGRSHLSQQKQGPSSSNYDSLEVDLDSMGRSSSSIIAYSGTAGQTNTAGPGGKATYDALNRKIGITNSSGLSVTLSYSQNDAYQSVGPAPTGENKKRKQVEYDALGRITSVCEITSATGSGTCAQTSPQTGYWTQYTYDVLGNLIGVTQNAQTSAMQTRSYTYDGLSRLTQEMTPESGTTTYTYDTDSTCGTSKGDLVKKVDAAGNVTCFAHDLLHRPTSVVVSSGLYASSTPSKYFVYDSATVNGIAMANVKARMAEAYTCISPCTSKLTDTGFMYAARGEVSDVYESTPHSNGYYHVSTAYWANGALNKLSSLVGLPTITYNVDGEGRMYSVSASSGQNPVMSTTYNPASLPTAINLGSLDSDTYTFDPNTNRMTQYKFNVNGQSVVGTPTWNALGTLASLTVTDPFFSGGNQSCTYSHDDLTRIASASCGTVWTQTFSYDAFGNLSKNGTISFQPTYSYVTNHITQVGSSTPSYDLNGNLTNDTVHTYAWDAAGRPVTIDSVNLTYDALGRMVEQNRSGTYTEIVYGPTGGKLALMSGQTLQKAFVPLPGGAVAVYTSSGLAYYRHSDWLGSSRFASTPTRGMYFDGAYAPFGEPYAQTGTTDLSFTGMNQDTVSGLYDFAAREYGIQGRWPSPDPAGIAAVAMSDPQTWNRYAYVRNSPLHGVDPQGLKPNWVCGDGQCGGEGAQSNAFDMGNSYATAANLLNSPYADPNNSIYSTYTVTTISFGGQSGSGSSDDPPDAGGALSTWPTGPGADYWSSLGISSLSGAPDTYSPDSTLTSFSWLGSSVTDMSGFNYTAGGPVTPASNGDFGIMIANTYQAFDQYGAVYGPGGATIQELLTNYNATITLSGGGQVPSPPTSNPTTPTAINAVVNPAGVFTDSPVGAALPASYPPGTTFSVSWTQTFYFNNVQITGSNTGWSVNSSAPGHGSISGSGLVSIGLSRP